MLALCMIVKNESKYLRQCLESVKEIVSEIVIVDTGSTDDTIKIAEEFTDKIYNFKWIDDFSKARNFAFSKATKDYILWLDADDIFLQEDIDKIKTLQLEEDAYSMVYNYGEGLKFRRNRIVKRSLNHQWFGVVHEYLDVNIGDSIPLDVTVTHTRNHSNGTRNIEIFKKLEKKTKGKMTTRDLLYYAKEQYYNGLYVESLASFNKYMSREDKWIEDEIDAYSKMYEISRHLRDEVHARPYLFKALNLGVERAEILYRLGCSFMNEQNYTSAIMYFECIERISKPENCAGFLTDDMWTWKPLLQLCVCYYSLGNIEKAKEYHIKTKEIVPYNENVIYNNQFFN